MTATRDALLKVKEAAGLVLAYWDADTMGDGAMERLRNAIAAIDAALAHDDRPASVATVVEMQEKLDAANERYRLLATELVYEGNSVQHWQQKARAYQAAIDAAWDSMRKAGHHPDGKTTLASAIDAALKEQAEPVAWMMVNKEHGHAPSLHWKAPTDWHITWEAVPLYTAPPKRQPLSENYDANDILLQVLSAIDGPSPSPKQWRAICDIARAVERALGIGGD